MAHKQINWDRLAKVMALAGSDKSGEAQAAMRAVTRMMDEAGLDFSALTDRLRDGAGHTPAPPPPQPAADNRGGDVVALTKRIAQLQEENANLQAAQKRAAQEIESWREKAWESVSYLCELEEEIRQLKEQKADQTAYRTNAEKREAVLVYLRDPQKQTLSDREIARRVGVSPQTVCNWRKTLRDEGEAAPEERVVHRNGATYTMQTENIGHRRTGTDGV